MPKATIDESYGKGNRLSTVHLENKVSAEKHVFSVVGKTVFTMPIRAITNALYELKGEIDFFPEQGRIYVIKGYLKEENSSTWIEDASSGEIIKFEDSSMVVNCSS